MKIYIEYAFLENLSIDVFLLYLTLKVLKLKISYKKIFLSGCIGGIFALLYPFINSNKIIATLLKLLIGVLLPLLSVNERGVNKHLFAIILFLLLSSAMAGFMLALYSNYKVKDNGYFITRIPVSLSLLFVVLFAFCITLITRFIYNRKKILKYVYDCKVISNGKTIQTLGFYDSGNCANYNGIPVCFVSPDLVFDIIGENYLEESMTILTMNGESNIKIFLIDKLVIYYQGHENIINKVYLSPSININSREYKIILNGTINFN